MGPVSDFKALRATISSLPHETYLPVSYEEFKAAYKAGGQWRNSLQRFSNDWPNVPDSLENILYTSGLWPGIETCCAKDVNAAEALEDNLTKSGSELEKRLNSIKEASDAETKKFSGGIYTASIVRKREISSMLKQAAKSIFPLQLSSKDLPTDNAISTTVDQIQKCNGSDLSRWEAAFAKLRAELDAAINARANEDRKWKTTKGAKSMDPIDRQNTAQKEYDVALKINKQLLATIDLLQKLSAALQRVNDAYFIRFLGMSADLETAIRDLYGNLYAGPVSELMLNYETLRGGCDKFLGYKAVVNQTPEIKPICGTHWLSDGRKRFKTAHADPKIVCGISSADIPPAFQIYLHSYCQPTGESHTVEMGMHAEATDNTGGEWKDQVWIRNGNKIPINNASMQYIEISYHSKADVVTLTRDDDWMANVLNPKEGPKSREWTLNVDISYLKLQKPPKVRGWITRIELEKGAWISVDYDQVEQNSFRAKIQAPEIGAKPMEVQYLVYAEEEQGIFAETCNFSKDCIWWTGLLENQMSNDSSWHPGSSVKFPANTFKTTPPNTAAFLSEIRPSRDSIRFQAAAGKEVEGTATSDSMMVFGGSWLDTKISQYRITGVAVT